MATVTIGEQEITGDLVIETTPEGGVEITVTPRVATIEERVRAGALMLDEFRPGWYRDVSLDNLDMGNGHCCILGQLYGQYYIGRDRIYGNGDEQSFADRQYGPARHGFFTNEYQEEQPSYVREAREYKALTAAWSEEITRRRSGC